MFIVLGIKHGEEKPIEKQTKNRRKSTDIVEYCSSVSTQ